MTTEPPKRRWFQFRLRTLLIIVLVLSLPLSWFAWKMEKARRQRTTIIEIESLGGRVIYDWQADLHHWDAMQRPDHSWQRRLFGDDFCDQAYSATLRGPEFFDSRLDLLKGLDGLKWVIVRDARVMGSGLASLRGIACLEGVSVDNCPLTDDGLKHLQECSDLECVCLRKTEISGDGLKYLAGLTSLRRLWLDDCRITDAGLRHLEPLFCLEELWLDNTLISDDGLTYVKGLPNLKYLKIRNTKVTPEGVEHLREVLPERCQIVY